jgi:hypothetical protein
MELLELQVPLVRVERVRISIMEVAAAVVDTLAAAEAAAAWEAAADPVMLEGFQVQP